MNTDLSTRLPGAFCFCAHAWANGRFSPQPIAQECSDTDAGPWSLASPSKRLTSSVWRASQTAREFLGASYLGLPYGLRQPGDHHRIDWVDAIAELDQDRQDARPLRQLTADLLRQ